VAADHALVRILVHLDAPAAAILGGLAGDFRLGDAVVQMQVRDIGRHGTPAHGHRVVGIALRAGTAGHVAADPLCQLARLR
jgi:hypothetical protein